MATQKESTSPANTFIASFKAKDRDASSTTGKQIQESIYNAEDVESAADEFASLCVESFQGTPEQWASFIEAIAVHIDSRRSDDPMLSTIVVQKYTERFVDQRLAFLSTINSYFIFRAVGSALSSLKLDISEALALLKSIEGESGDYRNLDTQTLINWAADNNSMAREIIQRRLSGDETAASLPLSALSYLAEGICKKKETFSKEWIDSVIEQLWQHNTDEERRLATYLRCFAWPEGHPVSERHSAMLESIRRAPFKLIPTGFAALQREGRRFPAYTIETICSLYSLAQESSGPALPQASAMAIGAATQALIGAKEQKVQAETKDVAAKFYSIIMNIPPAEATHSVDHFLCELVDVDESGSIKLFQEWCLAHAHKLGSRQVNLANAFSLFFNKLGGERLGNWILKSLTSPSAELRALVSMEIIRSVDSPGILISQLPTLNDVQAKALIHQLVGSRTHVDFYIHIISALARARSQLLDFLKDIVATEAFIDYPSSCHKWIEDTEVEPKTDDDPLTAIKTLIEDSWRRRADEFEAKKRLVDLWTCCPAMREWNFEMQRIQDRASERIKQSGGFIAHLIATDVPIARGEGTVISATDTEIQRFGHYEFSTEIAVRDVVDPLGKRLSSAKHLQQAEDLVQEVGP